VQAGEVDRALDHVAGQNGMTRTQLLVAVERSAGMTEADYRAEIERQILEAKLLQLEVQQRNAFVREEELEALYAKVKKEDPDGTPAYDEARSALLARLQTERMQLVRVHWVRRLREQAYVEIRWVP
jgi:FKBP-type peptidyl-prolyl cis-trans isomerase (trigger factor)